ncbi:AAA family ATPase [Clostridium ljungdahlii]
MNLKKLRLCRFRCFGDDEQEIYFNNLTTLIGNNSCGKTTVLQALLKLFSYNSNERNLIRSDFFLPKGVKPDEMQKQDLYIEAVFDFPELDDKNIENKDSIPIFFRHFIVEEPSGKPYLRIRLEASWEKGNNVDGSIESRISYIVCPEEDQIKEEDRKIANRHELDKIRMIYVPAVRDPSKQLRNVSGTMMYQIMKSINWKDDTKESVDKKIEELNEEFEKETGISILKDSIRTQWKNYDSDYRYSNADMRFNNVDMDSMLKGSEVVFSPTVTGRKYCIDEMGDGLRSLFYISLVNSMLEVESVIRKEMN